MSVFLWHVSVGYDFTRELILPIKIRILIIPHKIYF